MKRLFLCLFCFFSLFSLCADVVDVCFLTVHPNSAHHFARFTKELDKHQITWRVIAGDSAEAILKQKKISHRKLSVWVNKRGIKNLSLEEQHSIAKLIVKECKRAKIIITDISEPLVAAFHHECALASSAKRFVYYDNPEPYVPGEYGKNLTALLNTKPDGIIFASHRLVNQKLFGEPLQQLSDRLEKVGLGFYPMEEAEGLRLYVEQKSYLRDKLFEELGIADEKQKILLYLGGASTPYFEQAFPFFLDALEEQAGDPFFDNTLFLLQQHPRAKEEAIDLYALLEKALPLQVFTSPLPVLEALACSDLTYYYQTSMVPYILLANRPLLQVAPLQVAPLQPEHEDLGVKMGLIEAVYDSVDLPMASVRAMAQMHSEASLKAFEEELGYDPNWPEHLLRFLKKYL